MKHDRTKFYTVENSIFREIYASNDDRKSQFELKCLKHIKNNDTINFFITYKEFSNRLDFEEINKNLLVSAAKYNNMSIVSYLCSKFSSDSVFDDIVCVADSSNYLLERYSSTKRKKSDFVDCIDPDEK